jgi:hypothetical protein
MRRPVLAALAWLLCHASVLGAQQITVPAELKPWEPWVMHGEEFRRCPIRPASAATDPGAFQCVWPGRLRVAVSATGGEFSQHVRLYAESWLMLPGDEAYWPEGVRVDGAPAAVVPQDGTPRLRLGPGEYTVSGRFTWSRRPESLRLPPTTALVDLSVDGKPITPVDLRHDRLWLGAVRSVTVPRALHVQVYRLLQDDIPLQLTTQLQLKISGDAREEVLAPMLPEGFVPTAAMSALPMRFEPDGRLRVQVRSGEHVLTIYARASAPADRVVVPAGEGPWAPEEIWSYGGNERLRLTAIETAVPIDPVQAGVPEEWRELPAFRLARGDAITIAERSRGLSSADANQLTLRRQLWLSFDHDSFVAADHITGTMQQAWRLDMANPYRLLNARQDEETMLITEGAQGRTGIEIRTPQVEIATLARTASGGAQPATGWDTRFESVWSTLHLPPGHRLLGAWGVDESPDAWLNQWRLLDLFLLMLVVAAAFRLLGWAGAAVAAGAIILSQHESYAPAWLWVNALVAVAIARVIPEGRLRRWAGGYRVLSFAALLLALAAFAVSQYRLAIHPQLQTRGTAAHQPLKQEMPEMQAADSSIQDVIVTGTRVAKRLERYAPNALLQTGPGIPGWQYLTYQLKWSGAVDPGQTVRLTILTPFWLSLWRIVSVLMSLALLAALVRLAYGVPKNWPTNWPLPSWPAAAPIVAACMLAAIAAPPRAAAQTPDAQILAELKKRLIEPAKCVPNCTQVAVASVNISGERLSVQMEVHAQASIALRLPEAGPQWVIESVAVDGRPTDSFVREVEQVQLPLAAGVHRVEVAGRIVQAYELSLEFPKPPRRIIVQAEGWDSSGASEGRLLNSVLQLTRRAGVSATERASAPQRFAPFVRIHRRVSMNLDWTVSTTVERLAPAEGAFTLRLPLLPGESVLTPGLEVREGTVLVSMPVDAESAQWESSLAQVDKLQWRAAQNEPWVEQWEVVVSPMWHAEFAGTPPILPEEFAADMWINQFLPRPGETLDIAVVRPAASAGSTLAVDRVEARTSFSQRLSDTSLTFSYRSSQGGRHDLRLPPDARVQSVSLDDEPSPVRPTNGVLPLTLVPGEHEVDVSFTRDEGVRLASRPPEIDLGIEGTNVRTNLSLADNRWVLFAWGNGVGPAILYWGELLLFAIVAVVLGRVKRIPLRTRDWLFLGLGLSTFSWWVLLVFGAWLFMLDSRHLWKIETRWRFNAMQVALGLFSLAALATLISAIPYGLLGQPDMNIRSEGGVYDEALSWFLDRSQPQLPRPGVISVSIWYYKLAMLLWALWLSFALLRWLPWAWQRYSIAGLWRGKVLKA